ncbi:MAG: UvrB/UvrC motif-containing protein [Phycisphaerales bacterium]|nr:UvrB/UvrC motif-containing protein [Phycisphaerales bacterium]
MSLDLSEYIDGWDCPRDHIAARLITGRDGSTYAQMRVDLGVLQMALNGRPDGERYHGLPTALDFVQHEMRVSHDLDASHWRELHRELQQFNYRRLALSRLADEALERRDNDLAKSLIAGAISDIEGCLSAINLLERQSRERPPEFNLAPTFVFNRARLRSRLAALDERIDEAIEEAEAGARSLEQMLHNLGVDGESVEEDAGVMFLRKTASDLRAKHQIQRTLQEQLSEAIDNDDFEAAARLRDEMRRRGYTPPSEE